MIRSKLNEIALREKGHYSIEKSKVVFTDGSRSPETHHKIHFDYNDTSVHIVIQTGFTETAKIISELPNYIRSIDFEIDSISPFINLFLRRKSRFKVKCKNENFKHFLKNNALKVFDRTMKTKNFDPRIYTENESNSNRIIFQFHLGFSNWIDIFDEIIIFLKMTIDELNSDNRFILNKIYKK